ncbi:MAG: ABC transporter permease [Planctomycetales bacterium]|nr:ABC transporter permease [Planctomycetales bacterium]
MTDSQQPAIVQSTTVAGWPVLWMLTWREIIRFFRQRNRVVGAVGQPILFWLLFGAGMNTMFQLPGQSFSEYYIPGTLVLILLFTAIFATISIIEDRNEGFLQSVLVAPIPRWSMIGGKVVGGTIIAVLQSIVFLLFSLTLGIRLSIVDAAVLLTFITLTGIGLTCLGVTIAWRLESTQGFHAIMNLLLMPMWLLSGAFFPVPAPTATSGFVQAGLHWLMRMNPVTYGVAGIRRLMFGEKIDLIASEVWIPQLATCWLVTIVFCVLIYLGAWRAAGRRIAGDLR